jgi:hypothetical protein
MMRTLELDAYVIETLMADLVGHDRRPSAFLVYLYLWAACRKAPAASAEMSLRIIAEGTGLSKRAVQHAIHLLARRRLITVHRGASTEAATYLVNRPWRRTAPGSRIDG